MSSGGDADARLAHPAVILGLLFVYFVFSMIVSKLNEAIAARWRGGPANSRNGCARRWTPRPRGLAARELGKVQAEQPHLSITPEGARRKLPSYISPRAFSLAILDLLAPGDEQVTTVTR